MMSQFQSRNVITLQTTQNKLEKFASSHEISNFPAVDQVANEGLRVVRRSSVLPL